MAAGYDLDRKDGVRDPSTPTSELVMSGGDDGIPCCMFTPRPLRRASGMKFPAKGDTFVGKDAMADYLESYATAMDLPVFRLGTAVDRVSYDGERYVVETDQMTLHSDNVVVAMAEFQVPKIPSFGVDLDSSIVQLHSTAYKNPGQLQPGSVLVVGLGNSGRGHRPGSGPYARDLHRRQRNGSHTVSDRALVWS